ncbi:MAG: flagellar hook-associated protein FlgK [Deltaproteobacteria bacterium RBG_13_60_28]|nr:MAG: flagellar hook-associated protein FlgK [Deltaproteobacteria bacterium RBG_13_60_28]
MSGILGLMDIAKRALAAQQLGVEVASHNISNVNTPGYSRQTALFEASMALPSPYGPLGYGVKVLGIERAFDSFTAAKLDENTSYLAYQKSLKADLEQVGGLFNETQDGGLSELMSGFWDAWNAVADNPSGSGERQALLTQAQNLADGLSSRADQLVTFRTSVTQRISPTIDEINSHAARIADLNREIKATETPEQQANDLRDQRQMELNKLSDLVGIRYYTTGDGTINVTLANGVSLVESVNAWNLRSEITPADTVSVIWEGPGGVEEDVTSGLSGGQLSAQIAIRDTLIPQYQGELDDLAKEFIAGVNLQHSQGVGLEMFSTATSSYSVDDPLVALVNNPSLAFGDRITAGTFNVHVEDGSGASVATPITITGATTLNTLAADLNAVAGISATVVTSGTENRLEITADSGYTFGFSQDDSQVLMGLGLNTFFKGDSAYSIGINDAVASNTNLIAAGQIDPTTGAHAVGDNSNALDLADLANQAVGPGGLTFADAYRELVSDIGLKAEQAGNDQNYYQGLVDQFTQLRDSVSGVSLDEELTNLIKFQRAYQAAAKMVTVADELFQTLLALKSGG